MRCGIALILIMLFERQRMLLTLLDAVGEPVGDMDFQRLLFLYTQEEEAPEANVECRMMNAEKESRGRAHAGRGQETIWAMSGNLFAVCQTPAPGLHNL